MAIHFRCYTGKTVKEYGSSVCFVNWHDSYTCLCLQGTFSLDIRHLMSSSGNPPWQCKIPDIDSHWWVCVSAKFPLLLLWIHEGMLQTTKPYSAKTSRKSLNLRWSSTIWTRPIYTYHSFVSDPHRWTWMWEPHCQVVFRCNLRIATAPWWAEVFGMNDWNLPSWIVAAIHHRTLVFFHETIVCKWWEIGFRHNPWP